MQKRIIDYINQYLLLCYVDTLYFIEKWSFVLDKNKEYVGVIMMDLSKAFDTINYKT